MGRSALSDQPPPAPRISAAWLIVPCLACDALIASLLGVLGPSSPWYVVTLAYAMIGCMLAQGNLLAAWLAWSNGPVVYRLVRHWGIALGLYLIWLLGMLAYRGGQVEIPVIKTTLFMPLVMLAAQIPLWVARLWFGWRLVREGTSDAYSFDSPLTIRDLLVVTFVVGGSLALPRLDPVPSIKHDLEFLSILISFALVISSIMLLPAGALLMRMHSFRRGLAWNCCYVFALVALLWAGVSYKLRILPLLFYVIDLPPILLTFAATVMLAAAIARCRGYRLAGRHDCPMQPIA